jgi:glycosyltransferase involved in cell wall biosynthesis
MTHLVLLSAEITAWVIAGVWGFKAVEVMRGLPRVPDLLLVPKTLRKETPSLTVVVPARNEEEKVASCIESLLEQDYPNLRIVAVDDRSTDDTGLILASLATEHPDRLRLLRVAELPADWLGKTHAMARAAAESESEYLLFTDADVLFAPDALSRAMAQAQKTGADHFVLAPTFLVQRWDEAVVLGVFQVLGLFAVRPWRVADPDSVRDAFGVGAFNLIRRSAYLQIGGFEALRMEIIEDIGMARRIKQAGLAQRLAFGRNLVRVHWASGALGITEVMTKNLFSALRFNLFLLVGACGWITVFCVLPFLGLGFAPLRLPALAVVAAMTLEYRALSKQSGIAPAYALLMPFGALLFVYAMLRSAFLTLRQGGVIWRGTLYPLAELRRRVAPIPWR